MSSETNRSDAGLSYSATYADGNYPPEGLADHIAEFLKATAEIAVAFGKGCRDVVRQSLVKEDSYIGRNFGKCSSFVRRRIGGPLKRVCQKLRVFNGFIPEDKDPLHVWAVVFFVSAVAFAGILVF